MQETITTREAAARLDVSVQRFHRLAATYDISPVFKAPGLRGASFWAETVVERLAEELAA